jgi:hypothetical protein
LLQGGAKKAPSRVGSFSGEADFVINAVRVFVESNLRLVTDAHFPPVDHCDKCHDFFICAEVSRF